MAERSRRKWLAGTAVLLALAAGSSGCHPTSFAAYLTGGTRDATPTLPDRPTVRTSTAVDLGTPASSPITPTGGRVVESTGESLRAPGPAGEWRPIPRGADAAPVATGTWKPAPARPLPPARPSPYAPPPGPVLELPPALLAADEKDGGAKKSEDGDKGKKAEDADKGKKADGDKAKDEKAKDAKATLDAPRPLAPGTSVADYNNHAALQCTPHELAKVTLPPYMIEPPDILLVEAAWDPPSGRSRIRGQHPVRPDGYISLGTWGLVYVAGLTTEEVRSKVAEQLSAQLGPDAKTRPKAEDIVVDVLSYNSKWYYLIMDGGGYGMQVARLPFTGNETILDAISLVGGLPQFSSTKRMWLARRSAAVGCCNGNVLPIDWRAITQCGSAPTNYQLLPGDRIYVKADKLVTATNYANKVLGPIDRVLSTILLGSETVNSIKGRAP